jgi:endonuclease/exonuclease/phosphatase family metal-dependent hydrolase
MTEFRQGIVCRSTGLALRHHDDGGPGEKRFRAFPAVLACWFAVFIGGCGQSGSVREAGDGGEDPAVETGNADSGNDLPKTANAKKNPDIEFTVLACNVENLFDIDGVALFDEYSNETYKPAHLLKKLQNVASLLATCGEKGPNIILFQEIEADQTAGTAPLDLAAILEKYKDQTIEKMLAEPVSEDVKDLPAAAFLAKALHDKGLGPYEVTVGEYRQDPTGRVIAHINVTFSRFPVIEARTHHSPGARGTLEVVHEVNGYPLHTFNNHWKSGAGDAESEPIRIGNAQAVRTRLNELLEADPNADIILGGDFNSGYNQALRYPQMQKTGLNAVLGSQGDELAIQQTGGPVLYNLWHELPVDKRGSDVYLDEWGTLIQMMLVRGLYDNRGIQYIDNSFSVLAIDNVNVQRGSGVPIRWNIVDGTGTGYSDHLPVSARFRTVSDDEPGKFLSLQNPGRQADITSAARKVDYSFVTKSSLSSIKDFGSDEAIRKLENLGQAYRVEAAVSGEKPFRVRVFDEEYNVWSYDIELRREIYSRFPVGGPMEFIGEIGIHEGKWQFVVRDVSWLQPDPGE